MLAAPTVGGHGGQDGNAVRVHITSKTTESEEKLGLLCVQPDEKPSYPFLVAVGLLQVISGEQL